MPFQVVWGLNRKNTVVHLINLTPKKKFNKIFPEETWSGKKPSLTYLRVFEFRAVIHIPKQKPKK